MPLYNPPSLAPFAAHNAAINGAVDLSQELGTTGATLANNTAKYTADQWEGYYNHAAATAVVTSGQVAAASFGAVLSGFFTALRERRFVGIRRANGTVLFKNKQNHAIIVFFGADLPFFGETYRKVFERPTLETRKNGDDDLVRCFFFKHRKKRL